MEEYKELEFFETGKMEMILELLKRDTNAFFAPPATDHDLRECYEYLKALALPHDIPNGPVQKDHTYFLKRHNGFAWNDIEFFSADAEHEIRPGYTLWDLYSMNIELYDINLYFSEDWCHRYLCIGRTADSFFLWDDDEETWEVCDRKTGEVTAVYDNFYTFFVTEIGRRIKLASNKDDTPPYSAEKISETTEPGIVQHCKRFTETVVDVEYQEKYGKTKAEWFEDYKKENYASTEDEMLAYLEAGGNYYARDDIPNAIEHYEKGIDILREYLVTLAIDCELYDDTEDKLAVAFENMLRMYKTMGKENGEEAASLISLFKYITFGFVDGIVKKEHYDLTGYRYYKTIQGKPDWSNNLDDDGDTITRRILLYLLHEGLTYWIILDFNSENDVKCRNQVYTFHTDKEDQYYHQTETVIKPADYKEVYEKLTSLSVDEVINNDSTGNRQEEIYFSLTLYDEFGSFDFNFSGVDKNNIKKRKLENICAVATRILEISDLKGTKFAKIVDILRYNFMADIMVSMKTEKHLEKAKALCAKAHYKKAVPLLQTLAAKGNAEAQNLLADCFYDGKGVAKDAVKAAEWWGKASAQGDTDGQYYFGWCCKYGEGVTQDYPQAIELLRTAAMKGHPRAQRHLGNCFSEGEGVEQDHVQAAEWWFKAAIQGERFAQGNLGFAFENGQGVAQDIFQAVNWYRKSAEQGNDFAQNCLANCYRYGNGTVQDTTKAIEWYTKAAEQGDEYAKEQLEQLAAEAEEANDDDGRYDAYV